MENEKLLLFPISCRCLVRCLVIEKLFALGNKRESIRGKYMHQRSFNAMSFLIIRNVIFPFGTFDCGHISHGIAGGINVDKRECALFRTLALARYIYDEENTFSHRVISDEYSLKKKNFFFLACERVL